MEFNEKTARLNALRQLLTGTDYRAIRAFEDAISLEMQEKSNQPHSQWFAGCFYRFV